MAWASVAAIGSSLLGGVGNMLMGGKQSRMANSIHPVNAVYNSSPYAANQLSSVRNAMNGRMAGAANAENNIDANQANSFQGAERNATSGSQALSVLAGLQGNTNQAFQGLQDREGQNQNNLLGQLGQANQGMTDENGKVYNDQLRNYNNDLQAKNALTNAAVQNRNAIWSSLGNAAIYGASKLGNGGNGRQANAWDNTPLTTSDGQMSAPIMQPMSNIFNQNQNPYQQSSGDNGSPSMWGWGTNRR